jgi:tRNA(Ile)-lysidine synthase|uniref:tRNA(Ile)-lysidine synthase, chloroplastic n=1 Tax=Cyanidiaceae sp. MX-AZ01 TaxID=1503164 RepID=A0A060ADN1_9RHOD|nr:cell-cycle protein mesJ family [Cyanidiaceae sp. MX-AZ01]
MSTYTQLHFQIQRWFQLSSIKNHTWLLAISGGQDSLCLLKIMHDLKPHALCIVHFDHRWSSTSAFVALRVYYLARYLACSWRYYRTAYDVVTEHKARQYRYANLIQLLKTTQFHGICTAHSASDDIETYLDQWLSQRNTEGIWRLCHLSASQILLRPLIGLTRAQTSWFTFITYLPTWSDISNYQTKFKRNQIRHQLLPYIKNVNKRFSVSVTSVLSPLVICDSQVWKCLPIWLQYQIATHWGLTSKQTKQLILRYNNKYELARYSSTNRFSACDSCRSYHFNLVIK